MPWDERWAREGRGRFQGGQSVSFSAIARDDSSVRAFVKTLRQDRLKDARARGRFRREAVAYETLAGLGPPRLLDDNADTWRDLGGPMYMALEYIDGVDFQKIIQRNGAVGVEDAMACTRELAVVLHRCHQNNVTHRDVKPANVVLRNNDVAAPVLVDFGLSFNDADEDDLTRVGEEVGNRFLRLPEHAFGERGSASDVTQLAGVFVYILTGLEPRVLIDQSGLKPHQRPEGRAALATLLDGRRLLRVMSVLDKAFATELSVRFASAPDLIDALERAMEADHDGGDDLEQLLAQVGEFAERRNLPALHARREKLRAWLRTVESTVQQFATANGLERSQTGFSAQATADEEWAETRLAVGVAGNRDHNFVLYRIESRGPGDYVLHADGEQIWRGDSVDQAFTDAVTTVAAQRFLSSQND